MTLAGSKEGTHAFEATRGAACWCGRYKSEHWPGSKAVSPDLPPAPPCYPKGCQPHCICLQIAAGIERLRVQ